MNYNEYLFSCLLKIYDKGFEQMEYDLQYERIAQRYLAFTQSKFNVDTKSEYECMIEYLSSKYTKYFEIHVFFSRNNGYSVPICINTKDLEEFDDDSIINFAVTFGYLNDDDAIMVDRVEEIEYYEYIDMGGK